MEKKKWVKLAGFAMIVLLSLFVLTGCAENSAEDCDEVTFIDFGREGATSRGIESWNEDLYSPEDLYWTYTAKKIRGNYTTGQTPAGEQQAVVKNGPAKGLGNSIGPFSVGVWEFNLFGYLTCAENTTGELVFSDLVYTGKTGTEEHNYITIDKRPAGDTAVQKIIFELTANSDFWDENLKGELAISSLKLTVPEGQRISGTKPASGKTGAEIIIRIWKGAPASGNDPIAESVSVFTIDINAGTILESGSVDNKLITPTFIDYGSGGVHDIRNKFLANTYDFYIAAMYQDEFTEEQEAGAYKWSAQPDTDIRKYIYDDGYAPIGAIAAYPLAIKAGVKTTIGGDINDIQVAEDANAKNTENSYIVTKILKTGEDGADVDDWDYYNSLKDAVAAYGTSGYMDNTVSPAVPNPIVQLRDIVEGETVTPGSNGAVVVQDTGKSFIVNDLTLSGANPITFSYGSSSDVKDYKFSGDGFKVVNLYRNIADSDMWLKTDGTGTVEVNAATDRVFHTGKAGTVNIVAVGNAVATDTAYSKGYHLGTDKDGSATVTNVGAVNLTKGRLEMNGNTCVQTLTIDGSATSETVSVSGRKSTVIKKYKFGIVSLKTTTPGSSGSPEVVTLTSFDATNATYKGLFAELCLNDAKDVATGSPTDTSTSKYYYLISGVDEALPAPFTFGDVKLLEWNTKKIAGEGDVATSYENKEKVALTKPEDAYTDPILKLYAQWGSRLVGGRIFYCDYDNFRCSLADYKFYKADGTAITVSGATGEAVVEALKDATYYYSRSRDDIGHRDMFYVLDTTNGFLSIPKFGGNGYVLGLCNRGVGGGKLNRDVIFNADGTVKSGKDVVLRVDPAEADSSANNKTKWAYVEYVNKWNGRTQLETSWGVQAPGGCTDWYIPNVDELAMMGVWAGVLSIYDAGVAGDLPKYKADFAGLPNPGSRSVPDTVTDDDKKLVWNAFLNGGGNGGGIQVSNESVNEPNNRVMCFMSNSGVFNERGGNKDGSVNLFTIIRSF